MIKLKLTIVGAVKGWFPFFPQHSSHSSLSRLYCTVPLSSLNIHHILLYLDYTVQSLYLPSIFITFFSIYITLYSPFNFFHNIHHILLYLDYTVQSLYLPSTFLTFFSIQIILYSPFIFPQHSSHSSLSRLYCTVPLSSLNIHHILLYLDYTVHSL